MARKGVMLFDVIVYVIIAVVFVASTRLKHLFFILVVQISNILHVFRKASFNAPSGPDGEEKELFFRLKIGNEAGY